MKSRATVAVPLLLPIIFAACGSNPPPEPVVLGVATDSAVAEPTITVAEPLLSLEERWESPFAVASSGSVRPAAGRDIVVLGADSALVGSLARRDGDRDRREIDTPPATSQSDEPRRGNAEDDRTVTIVVDRTPERRDAGRSASGSGDQSDDRVTTHRVEAGESWLEIARRYGMTYSELQRANPAVEPDRLRIGQVLRVERTEASRPSGALTHRVAPGESLFQIARRYDVPIAMLRDVNGLSSDRITPNQLLVIPRSADRD